MTEEVETKKNGQNVEGLSQMAPKTAEAQSELPCGKLSLEDSWGNISVEISDDFMTVMLCAVELHDAQTKVTADMVTALLLKNKITYGIASDRLTEEIDATDLNSEWSGRVIVVQGSPPGLPGPVSYDLFGPEANCVTEGSIWTIDGQSLSFPTLKLLLNSASIENEGVLAKAVEKGEVIAVRHNPLSGKPGKDIYGRIIAAPKFNSLLLDGDNVDLVQMQKFTAMNFGYIFVHERRLDILSPIRVADDNMTAWFVNLPQLPPVRSPKPAEIVSQLKRLGITTGILQENIEAVCHDIARQTGDCWIAVARGKEPESGRQARLELTNKKEKQPGEVRQDGSLDYRVLNLVQTVTRDSLIATKFPPSDGNPGYTLTGTILEAEPGQDFKMEGKENVRAEEKEDGRIEFYAESEGLLQIQNDNLSVDPLYRIKGNVDFSTGNIDVDCSLEISGSVCSDFTVSSTRNVVIGGSIELGASVSVKGDLVVKGGILGERTKVIVYGNLEADYIQAANIVVKGNIVVAKYIYYATVRAIGSITVVPGNSERAGSITGGVVYSSTAVKVAVCGSPSYVPTLLAMEPAPHKLAQLRQLKENISRCNAVIAKIMRTLGLQKLDREAIIDLTKAVSKEKKKLYLSIFDKLQSTISQKNNLSNSLKKLRRGLRKDVAVMSISVSRCYYGNTTIRIAKGEFLKKDDLGPCIFSYRNKRIIVSDNKQPK